MRRLIDRGHTSRCMGSVHLRSIHLLQSSTDRPERQPLRYAPVTPSRALQQLYQRRLTIQATGRDKTTIVSCRPPSGVERACTDLTVEYPYCPGTCAEYVSDPVSPPGSPSYSRTLPRNPIDTPGEPQQHGHAGELYPSVPAYRRYCRCGPRCDEQ